MENKPRGYGTTLLIAIVAVLPLSLYVGNYLALRRTSEGEVVYETRGQEIFYRPLDWINEKMTGVKRKPHRY